MKKLKLIYGTDTRKTEEIINLYLLDLLEDHFQVEVVNLASIKDEDWTSHYYYIISSPTWWDGDLQSDWEEYLDKFEKISFKGKQIALFGLGDQVVYAEWYCDGLGILGEIIQKNGGKLHGFTEKDSSYTFNTSKAVKNNNILWGLALDDDNQSNLNKERLENWVNQIVLEFN